VPGTVPVPGRRCALGTTREGSIDTSVGDQLGHPRGKRFTRFRAQGRGTDSDEGRINSWAGPNSGNGTGAPAEPDSQKRGKDWPFACSSIGSSSVIASAISGISYTDMETYF